MRRKSLTLAFAAAAVILTACEPAASGEVSDASAGNNRPSDSATNEEGGAPIADAPANPVFGQTYTFEDGLAVTVSAPRPYTPSEYAYVDENASAFLAFDVTIVNGTSANYEPSIFSTTLQSGNAEAQEVFDSANNLTGSPSTPILPGRESAFTIAYGVTNPTDLVMQVSPGFGFDYEPALFTL